ncbi:M42 family metallopeptidase [Luteolibacter algae]|uniref:M42 family metallopeptidase n=1 Tax=Luteolibacter algae TaxID=454151 RepID=A0ABW5DAM8_9BACT
MRAKALSLLQELTEAHSVSGHEDEVRAIFIDELSEIGPLAADKNGSVICAHSNDGPRVLIAGHMDEVGFMVQNMTLDGFIQFVAIGGWSTQHMLGQRVQILTRNGDKIMGVIGSKPVHFLPPSVRDQPVPIEAMFIDVGASSRRELRDDFDISIGDPIAPWSPFTPLARSNNYLAKAFDNRVGMAGVIQSATELAGTDHPNEIVFAGSVQEEVGLRGARTLAAFVKPDVAIVLEGPPADDTPGFNLSESQGKLGGGVQIRLYDPTAITNPRLAQLAIQTAEKANIPHQVTVRRSGGTDAGALHQANQGIPTIVLGVPARYIHTHNAIIDIDDYLAMVSLTIALAGKLDDATVDSLTRYI